jgi:transposase
MSKRIYDVVPTAEEKERLEAIAYTGTHPVRRVVAARLLLKAAAGVSDPEIAQSLDLALSTVAATRKRFCTKGLEACLKRREQQNRFRKITGDVEARIVQIACSEPPEGCSRWTLNLLVDRVIELEILPSIGRSAIAEVLKKTRSSPGVTATSASLPNRTASS